MTSEPERWRRAPDALWRRSLDTVIVLPPGLDEPITLAATGPAIWDALAEERSFDALVAVLVGTHGAPAGVVAADVGPVLEQLAGLGAVERVDGPGRA